MYAQNLQIPVQVPQATTVPIYYGPPSQNLCPAPPSAQQSRQVIINVGSRRSGSLSLCPACGKETGNFPKRTLGPVAIMWCLTLTVLTLGAGCCYVICNDSCKDVEILCVKCQTQKSKIPATCC